jgi:hypothetical protein
MKPGAPKRAAGLALVACIALAACVLFSTVRTCPMAIVLRVPCPGCGMTRAALALARGDLSAAWRLHPLSIVVVPAVLAFLAANAWSFVARGELAKSAWMGRAGTPVLWVLAALMTAVWIARFFGWHGGPVAV